MKKQQNKTLRIASVLLVLALVTTVALTGTLARYTAETTAASQYARVAAFRVLVNGAPIADDLTFDLFKQAKILDHDLADDPDMWVNNETDVVDLYTVSATTPPDAIIAPGMGNFASIEIENLSEVPVTVAFTPGTDDINAPENLKFYFDGTASVALDAAAYAALADGAFTMNYTAFTTALAAIGTLDPGDPAKAFNVAWRWIYTDDVVYEDSANDPIDTAEGTDVADILGVRIGAAAISCGTGDCGKPNCTDCNPGYDPAPTDAGELYYIDLAALTFRVTQVD